MVDQSSPAVPQTLRISPNSGVDQHFSLRRWKFEHWFAGTCLAGATRGIARADDGHYLDPRAELAWRAWNEAVATVTDIPPDWELNTAPGSRLSYEFKWLYGIETGRELERNLTHEPRLFETAVRLGYVRPK